MFRHSTKPRRGGTSVASSGKKVAKEDFYTTIVDISSRIDYKYYMLMFLVFVLLSSDVFIGRILSGFKGAVSMKTASTWGVILQGTFMVMAMATIEALVSQKII